MLEEMNFKELIEHLEASQGRKVEIRIRQLQLMNHIFITNFSDLSDFFMFTKDERNAIEIIRTGNKEVFESFSFELTRHFFNFITATKAYIDQTRRWVNTYYKSTDFEIYYTREVDKVFINNILCKFIQDLRNYQTHYMIPFTAYSASFSTEQPLEFKISLSKDKLLEYNKWTSDSINYINSFEKDINVEAFCNDYFDLIKNFYESFFKKIMAYHKKDFEDLEVIKEELRKRHPQPIGIKKEV
jgi:hypothetical protein